MIEFSNIENPKIYREGRLHNFIPKNKLQLKRKLKLIEKCIGTKGDTIFFKFEDVDTKEVFNCFADYQCEKILAPQFGVLYLVSQWDMFKEYCPKKKKNTLSK